jgi:hypothetical protein
MRLPTIVVFALLAALASSSSPLAASLDRFVFNGERAVNVRNQNEFVQIGEKLPIIELKRRFRRYKIVSTAGEDCSICATISNKSSSIYVDYDGDGIVIVGIRSLDKTSIDSLGNAVGSSVRNAIGAQTADCDAGDVTVCYSPRLGGLSYVVEEDKRCQLSIPAAGHGDTAIPRCVKIAGFQIQRRN